MSEIAVALQPGGCGRALRTLCLLDDLDLPATRLFLCGAGDAALIEPELRTGDRLEICATVASWADSVSRHERGLELLWLDVDLDRIPAANSDVGRVLTSDCARLRRDDELRDEPDPRLWKRRVAPTAAALWWGEITQIPGPERRVAMRSFFHEAGFVSGLAHPSFQAAEARDDALSDEPRLRIVRGQHPDFDAVVDRARALGWALDEDPRDPPQPGLATMLQHADAALVPGGLGILAECSGLSVPTLCLPGSAEEEARAAYFGHRYGILGPARGEGLEEETERLLGRRPPSSPLPGPSATRQRANVRDAANALRKKLRRSPTKAH